MSARQLVTTLVLAVTLALAGRALADGEVVLRGNYWRDRNTRVLAPEADLRKTLPTGTTVEAGYLLDAITSASAAAGVMADQPFTELRHELGLRATQQIGPVAVGAQYRYSTESDYWAHTGGVSVALDLLQKNLTLAASYVYTQAEVARRASALGYVWANGTAAESRLRTHYGILSASQVLAPWALLSGAYELAVLDGFQANAYRTVRVSGTPVREVVPSLRLRHALSAELRLTPVFHHGVVGYFTTALKYRFYIDDWGVIANAPEARAYLALGPTELRLTLRYYHQTAADFYRSTPTAVTASGETRTIDLADYPSGGVPFAHCPPPAHTCYTGDSKLSSFWSVYLEGRVQLALRFLDRPKMPLGHWLGAGLLAVSVGHYWNTNYAWAQFGDAWTGGLELTLPL